MEILLILTPILKMTKMSDQKKRMRAQTSGQIEGAIAQLIEQGGKISISSVAKFAGITPGLIHNSYPDLAENIRALAGKGTRAQRDEKHDALITARADNRKLREENATLNADLAKQVSINQTLLAEIALLRGVASGKVIKILSEQALN
jgi:transposase-like protein